MWGAFFPGQGSQSIGMGRFLYDNFASCKQLFEEAGDTLRQDFKKLLFEGPDSELALTENTQPALVLCSVATFRAIGETCGLTIGAGSGHSVGEYSACVAAGNLNFADALRAVRARGQAMQKAVPVGQGGMLAVLGLSDEQVIQLCQWVEKQSGHKPLEPANFNTPGQVVVSGSAAAVEWARANAKADLFAPETPRLKLIPLNVSAPFHCSMMAPAETTMRQVLAEIDFRDPDWPIVQNVTAQPTRSATEIRQNLVAQVCGAVRWTQCVQRLHDLGVRKAVEFGSGKVLAGLAKKIDSHPIATFNINSLEDIKTLEQQVSH